MTTVTRSFKVNEIKERWGGEIAWLRLLEGEKKNLDFAVPIEDSKLQVGEQITVTLEATHEKNIAWRIKEIHDRSNP